jgi:hypothetical protein
VPPKTSAWYIFHHHHHGETEQKEKIVKHDWKQPHDEQQEQQIRP